MLTYIARRLLLLPVTVFGVSLFVFRLLYALPIHERVALLSVETHPSVHRFIRLYGLDRPFYEQYWRWLVGHPDSQSAEWIGGILRGDFGYSRSGSMPVVDLIIERLPATFELVLYSMLLIVLGSVGLGIINIFRDSKWVDKLIRILSKMERAYPSFLLALLLLMYFYSLAGWFPVGRYDEWVGEVVYSPTQWRHFTNLLTIDALLNRRLDIFWNALLHLIAPVITLSNIQCVFLFPFAHAFMKKILRKETTFDCHAKDRAIHTRVQRQIIPVATILGSIFVNLLNGTIIAETIFAFPGIGQITAHTAVVQDLMALIAILLLSTFTFVIGTLLIDIAHVYINRAFIGNALAFRNKKSGRLPTFYFSLAFRTNASNKRS